ncbi:MAG TPA: efflux RND transporter periplasmic adaptor subunit [Rhizomicrobium sp.]|nr:efflux RND transporter periplasmic adaptor subunit [Rhizomicrobium sp.]
MSEMRIPVTCVAIALAVAACGQQNHYAPPPPPKVAVAYPIQRSINRYLEVTGTTVAINTTDLVARVPGYLHSIDYADGAFVKAGTLLFTIEPELYEVKLKQARDAAFGAQASLKNAQTTYHRYVELDKVNAIAKTMLDQALANRDNAQSTLLQDQVNVRLAELNVEYAHVRAPYDGVVTARQVSLGEYVGGGATPTELATVVQTNPIYVNFNISELDVLRFKASGKTSRLTLADLSKIPVEVGLQTERGYPHVGVADYAAPTFTSSTGTLVGRGILANNDGLLLPGAFVRVRVPVAQQPGALLIPDAALGSDQGGRYALVVGENNVVEERTVQIGELVDGLRAIDSGLAPSDRVVVSGLMKAVPGERVEPEMQVAAAAESRAR